VYVVAPIDRVPVLENPIVESTVITDAPSPTSPILRVFPGTTKVPSVRLR
jgi:hypothetical protein